MFIIHPLQELADRGGPVIYAILAVALVLYTGCIHLLLSLYWPATPASAVRVGAQHGSFFRRESTQLRDNFRQRRLALGSLVAAAPLLGLLGTVGGMIRTFENLNQSDQKSMEGLASGISEVLVTTESGLAVAIPAMLLIYMAHRQVERRIHRLNEQDEANGVGGQP